MNTHLNTRALAALLAVVALGIAGCGSAVRVAQTSTSVSHVSTALHPRTSAARTASKHTTPTTAHRTAPKTASAPAPKPKPVTSSAKPAPVRSSPRANCDPSYPDTCLHDGIGDYDCAGGSGNGPNYVDGPVQVRSPDPFRLDADHDGVGCES